MSWFLFFDLIFTLSVCTLLLAWGGWSLYILATLDIAALLRGGRAAGRAAKEAASSVAGKARAVRT